MLLRHLILSKHLLLLYFIFSVSEYIDGGELFHLLEQYGSLPEYLVAVYVAEIALGLGKIIF